MIIALGSTSEDKKNTLLAALESLGVEGEIACCSVSSGVTDQPLDEETTITGAANRARAALMSHADAAIGMGMEGGLIEVANAGYFLVCAAVIATKSGKEYVGVSSKLRLPSEVTLRVKKGEQFGDVIREYEAQHEKTEALTVLTHELIGRQRLFTEAIQNAVLSYTNEAHFVE